jgi:hypothetical protein
MNALPTARLPRAGMAALALSMLLASLGTGIVAVALPTLAQAFGAGMDQVRHLLLAYLLSVTVLVVVAGRLGDRFGQGRVLIVGVAVFMAGSLLCALAPTLPWLVAGRAVQGAGAAAMIGTGLPILAAGCAAMALVQVRFGAPAYLAALVLMTLGYAIFQAANTTAAMARVDTGSRGALGGCLGLARNIGLLAGTAGLGAVFGAAGDAGTGLQWCFGAASVLVALAMLLARGRTTLSAAGFP